MSSRHYTITAPYGFEFRGVQLVSETEITVSYGEISSWCGTCAGTRSVTVKVSGDEKCFEQVQYDAAALRLKVNYEPCESSASANVQLGLFELLLL